MGLSPTTTKGLLRLLVVEPRPEVLKVNPLLGYITSSHWLWNVAQCHDAPAAGSNSSTSWKTASLLARELFSKTRDDESFVSTRSRSNAGSYLTPKRIGTVIGLSAVGATQERIDLALREVGIQTNKVDGEWTGVSLARYKRIIELVSEAWAEPRLELTLPSMLVMQRLLWERARTKQDLLEYLRVVDGYVPVLCKELKEGGDPMAVKEFVNSEFTLNEIESVGPNAFSSLYKNNKGEDKEQVELLGAAITACNGFKPTLPVTRHTFQNGERPVNDCVEVVVREILEYLLFDANAGVMNTLRLPREKCTPWLIDFYSKKESLSSSPRVFFDGCSRLDGAEYIRNGYELMPDARNVIFVLGKLLSGNNTNWSSPTDLEQFWQSHCPDSELNIRLRVERFRSSVSEEVKVREILVCIIRESPLELEASLDRAHQMATCTQRRKQSGWALADDTVSRNALAGSWARGETSFWGEAFAPALLGDRMLLSFSERNANEAYSSSSCAVCDWKRAAAILAARWGSDRNAWNPLESESRPSEVTAEVDTIEIRQATDLLFRACDTAMRMEDQNLRFALLRFIFSSTSNALLKANAARLASQLSSLPDVFNLRDILPSTISSLLYQDNNNTPSLSLRLKFAWYEFLRARRQ